MSDPTPTTYTTAGGQVLTTYPPIAAIPAGLPTPDYIAHNAQLEAEAAQQAEAEAQTQIIADAKAEVAAKQALEADLTAAGTAETPEQVAAAVAAAEAALATPTPPPAPEAEQTGGI